MVGVDEVSSVQAPQASLESRSTPWRGTRRLLIAGTVAVALVVGLAGCSPGAKWNAPGETPDPPKVNLSSPTDGSTDVPASAELVFSVEGTRDVTVAMTGPGGKSIAGAMRDDGSSWIPAEQLDWGAVYSATITARKTDGTSAEAKTTFTTMEEPARLVRVLSYNGDHVTYGVGMPIIVRFSTDVPEGARADIQRRMFVTSEPAQEGVWHWISSRYHNPGSEAHYRPKVYWLPGTKISVRIATGGMPWGFEGIYGGNDLTLQFSIGDSMIMDVDNATKQMTVTQNGQVTRTIPVSLGKPSTPSSSGQMLVMSRNPTYTFDTRRELGNREGYVVDVNFAEQLTTGGEFIHAAPWSVNEQGVRNVSHGCVNMSDANAEWIFNSVKVGDPVIVKGTEVTLAWGNGFTDWDRPWEEYVKGSAIPYTPPAATSPSPSVTG
jgi:lipoprotein-anchoring transpeptidase ErfK/SrfK